MLDTSKVSVCAVMSKIPYVSDPVAWEAAINKSRRLKNRQNNQLGRGFARSFKRKSFVIPLKNPPENEAVIERVAPTVAIEKRAESELRQQRKEEQPHIKEGKPKSNSIRRTVRKKNISIGKSKRNSEKSQSK